MINRNLFSKDIEINENEESIHTNLIKGSVLEDIKYTILIPVYRCNETFSHTLQSALKQDFNEFQIVVIEDGPDPNGSFCEKYINEINDSRVVFYRSEKNLGMAGNWNRGVELCKSDYIILLCQDDLLSPRYLSIIDSLIKRNKDVGCISALSTGFDGDGDYLFTDNKKKKLNYKHITLKDLYFGIYGCVTGMTFSKKIFNEIGRFKSSLLCLDTIFMANMALYSKYYVIFEELIAYRRFENTSMKLSTQYAMIDEMFTLRNQIAEKYFFFKNANRSSNKILTIGLIKGINANWNAELSLDEMINRCGYKDSNITLHNKIQYRFIWFITLLSRKIRNISNKII